MLQHAPASPSEAPTALDAARAEIASLRQQLEAARAREASLLAWRETALLAWREDGLRERQVEAERLRNVTAQLAILLDHLSTGVVFSDRNGNVQIVNRAMGMLLGMSNPARLVGTHTSDPIHAERLEDPESVARLTSEREAARVPVIGDRLQLRNGRILERDYLPVEMRGAFGGDLWCYRDVTDRERARAQLADQANVLRELSMRDELTGLKNRRGFMILGEQQVKLADRSGRPVAVFFIDLNGMKAINDGLGHDEGDRALLEAGQLLLKTFRDSDVVARLGGDEFVVLATDCPAANVAIVRERLQDAIDAFNAEGSRRYELSMSIGVATYEPQGRTPRGIEELMAEADARMYDEKARRYRSAAPRSSVVCARPTVAPSMEMGETSLTSLPPPPVAARASRAYSGSHLSRLSPDSAPVGARAESGWRLLEIWSPLLTFSCSSTGLSCSRYRLERSGCYARRPFLRCRPRAGQGTLNP